MLAITGNNAERILIKRSLPRKFAHLYVLSIRSFDCLVLRSFHTPSQCDFRSNVIRPHWWSHCVVSLSETFISGLVLIEPIKTCPDMSENILTGSLGRKES